MALRGLKFQERQNSRKLNGAGFSRPLILEVAMERGQRHTPETKKKLSESAKRRKVIPPSRKGCRTSEDTKKKLSLANIGEKHWMWKGGISKIDKRCRRMSEYIQWRSLVFERDNWTCQTCRIRGVYVTAHHIIGFSKIIRENDISDVLAARKCKELWNIDNGVTLCEDCHSLTDNYKGRGVRKEI